MADMRKMEAQLKVWDAKIEKLAAKAEEAHGRARIDFQYHVDDLKVRRAVAETRLVELRAAGAEEQEGVEVGLEIAWNELETAIKDLGL
jgi:hypothetical protein